MVANEERWAKTSRSFGHSGQEEVEDKEEKHAETDDLICLPCDPVEGENVDVEVEQEAEAQIPATDPGQPTQAPIDEHDVLYTVLVYLALVFASFANTGSTAMRRGLEHSHTRPGTLE